MKKYLSRFIGIIYGENMPSLGEVTEKYNAAVDNFKNKFDQNAVTQLNVAGLGIVYVGTTDAATMQAQNAGRGQDTASYQRGLGSVVREWSDNRWQTSEGEPAVEVRIANPRTGELRLVTDPAELTRVADALDRNAGVNAPTPFEREGGTTRLAGYQESSTRQSARSEAPQSAEVAPATQERELPAGWADLRNIRNANGEGLSANYINMNAFGPEQTSFIETCISRQTITNSDFEKLLDMLNDRAVQFPQIISNARPAERADAIISVGNIEVE